MTIHKTRAAIVGASGYTGQELMRILAVHPRVELTAVTSRQHQGQKVTQVFPSLSGRLSYLESMEFTAPEPAELKDQADFFFTAVPHKTAMGIVPDLLEGGKVVDLSADFRFYSARHYEEWYSPHTAPGLLNKTVYGLPELNRKRIKKARLVGNPGCYPTSVILGLAPGLSRGLLSPEGLIADSKSGVSGAGRGLSLTSLFCEVNDGLMAYKVTGHRHTAEIEQELSTLADSPVRIAFTPHLIPMSRGILSTIYARPAKAGLGLDELHAAYEEFYADSFFVRVRAAGSQPHTLNVRGTNFCDLALHLDERTGLVKIVSVIDNLTRGASGQAVANMNLMQGYGESEGLTALGLRP